jgi:hypothetical protein
VIQITSHAPFVVSRIFVHDCQIREHHFDRGRE